MRSPVALGFHGATQRPPSSMSPQAWLSPLGSNHISFAIRDPVRYHAVDMLLHAAFPTEAGYPAAVALAKDWT